MSAVLRQVHERVEVTRADLTEVLGLNRSTVADLVGALSAAGLVAETRPVASSGRVGRPSLVVRPVAEAATVLAVSVDVHRLQVFRVGLGGVVLERRTEPLAPPVRATDVARQVAQVAAELVPGAAADRVAAVGIAVPGTVRSLDGTVSVAPHLGWEEVPLADRVGGALEPVLRRRPPVRVANDADLGVLAERLRGVAVGSDHIVYVCGTYGLGGGIVSGGRELSGSRGFAGEIGHVSVDAAGRACRCGSRGCWESEAMAAAWAHPLGLDPGAPDIAQQVLARLAVGDVAARRTRDIVSRSYARGLASLANVFDPEMIVVGDGLWWELWPEVADDVMPWLQRLVIPVLRERLPVRLAGLGRESAIRGAAEMAFAALLADPTAVLAPAG